MGLTDKITGRFKKAAGDLADDPSLRREGRKEERKGEAKNELAHAEEKVENKAQEVGKVMGAVEGVTNLKVEPQVVVPQLEVKLRTDAASRLGLTPGDVRRSATTRYPIASPSGAS